MKKSLIVLAGIGGIVLLGAILITGMIISTLNQEATLRVAIQAKQRDNTSEFDNMFKTIAQTAEVSTENKNALKEIFIGYAEARSGNNKNGSLATWVKEAVPNANLTTFNNLQNIIVSHRDSWTQRQKELLDLNREHERLLNVFPSSLICSIFGRKSIDVTIVTSTRTEKAFQSGKDDDTGVFRK